MNANVEAKAWRSHACPIYFALPIKSMMEDKTASKLN